MGRRPWATPEQLVFLRSYQHELPQAKAGSGLNVLYTRVARDFMLRWQPEPFIPDDGSTATAEQLSDKVKARLYDVRFVFPSIYSTVHSLHQRVMNWYKEFLKSSKKGRSRRPYQRPRPLDLTGRSNRKKPPYQLYQAFSVRNWCPKDSLLRREVDDLWARRHCDVVREPLSPFVKASGGIMSLTRLQFHMVVMEWKCSSLSSGELAALRDWISEQQTLNECPWTEEAKTYRDSLVAENRHIQRLVVCPVTL